MNVLGRKPEGTLSSLPELKDRDTKSSPEIHSFDYLWRRWPGNVAIDVSSWQKLFNERGLPLELISTVHFWYRLSELSISSTFQRIADRYSHEHV